MISKRMFRFGMIATVLLGLAVLVLGWGLLSTYYDLPEPTDEYREQLRALIAEGQPEGENGWPAFSLLMAEVEEALDGDVWSDAPHPELGALVTSVAFQKRLEDVLAHDRFVSESRGDGPMSHSLLPEAGPARRLVEELRRQARSAAIDGDWDQVEQFVQWSLGIRNMVALQSLAIWHVIAISLEHETMRLVHDLTRETDVPEAICVMLDDTIARLSDLDDRRAARAETFVLADDVHWLHGSSGRALPIDLEDQGAMLNPDGSVPSHSEQLKADRNVGAAWKSIFERATRTECLELVDRWSEQFVAATTLPYADRLTLEETEEFVAMYEDPRFEMVESVLPLTSLLIHVTCASDQALVMRSATRLMLAIERFEQSEGRLPVSLEELVPRFLAELPSDASWGVTTGAGFGYRVCEAGEWHGQTYLLYVLGADGEDQGGSLGEQQIELFPWRNLWEWEGDPVFDIPLNVPEDVLDARFEEVQYGDALVE